MDMIGKYKQTTEFSTEHAGTAEWCFAELDGKKYFAKRFQSPVYPTADLGLSPAKEEKRKARFHESIAAKEAVYQALREHNTSGALVVPELVIAHQYHICTVAEAVPDDIRPEQVKLLSPWQRVMLMRTLALALLNVHDAGLVHGDLRLDNLMIGQDQRSGGCRLRLIDFDAAFWADKPPKDVGGDPAYYAPEVFRISTGEEVRLDHRIDTFALGLILHYFWCGQMPDKPADQTIGQCLLGGGEITLNPSLPPELRALVSSILVADPEKRPGCQEIYDALEPILASSKPNIVILNKPKKEAAGDASAKKNDAGRGKGAPVSAPKPSLKDPATVSVSVVAKDTDGKVIRSATTSLRRGSSHRIAAPKVPGYRLAGTVGYVDLNIPMHDTHEHRAVFVYRKSHKSLIIALSVLGAVLLAILLIGFSGHLFGAGSDSNRVSVRNITLPITASSSNVVYPVSIPRGGDYAEFIFTPRDTGVYCFYSTSNSSALDPCCELYKGSSTVPIDHDDNGGDGQNFLLSQWLYAGTEYRLRVKMSSGAATGQFRVYFIRKGD